MNRTHRRHHTSVYAAARKAFLIYGGYIYDGSSPRRVGDVRTWNGSTWQLAGDTSLHKIVAPLAFDSKRKRILMFGGSDDSDNAGYTYYPCF